VVNFCIFLIQERNKNIIRELNIELIYFIMDTTCIFSVGQLVKHKLFDYRGVIVDVDPEFMLSDEWYEAMAKSRPPKDQPWYRVLVHNAIHETYVAQRNLELDTSGKKVDHPEVKYYFSNFENGRYIPLYKDN